MIDNLAHRFDYHPPSNNVVVATHETARAEALAFARAMDSLLPEGREKALVMTKIEEAMFWANAAIARTQLRPPSQNIPVPGVHQQ